VAWLQHHLEAFPGCVILVTHDRYFLDQVTKWTLELDRGKGIPYEGNYSGWLEQKQKRVVQEQSESEARQRALTRELEWVRSLAQGPSVQVQGPSGRLRAKWSTRRRTPAPPRPTPTSRSRPARAWATWCWKWRAWKRNMATRSCSRTCPSAAAERHRRRHRPQRRRQVDPVQADHRPRATPDGGTVKVGETVKLSYVDQSRDALDPNKTIWEEISGGTDVMIVGKREINSRAYVGSFNFKGGDQQKKVGLLSGGERNRVHLAKTLATGGNLILLDEPTNDLDIETLQNLEEALEEFAGCAVVISHDRWFLDRLATHILAFEGDSHVEWFEGNFDVYVRGRQEAPPGRRQPHAGRAAPSASSSRSSRANGRRSGTGEGQRHPRRRLSRR
jgi:ATPase subunit of ABC transporter with duplicated ATPase domains